MIYLIKFSFFSFFPVNQTTAFTFNIEASANYMVEAWIYNSDTKKLVPTAVKYI